MQCLLPQQSVTLCRQLALGDAGCWIFGFFPAWCWDFPWLELSDSQQGNPAREALPCQRGHQETTSNSSIFVWETKLLSSPVGSLGPSASTFRLKGFIKHFPETTGFFWSMNASSCTHIKASEPFCLARTCRPKVFFCLVSFSNNLSGSPSASVTTCHLKQHLCHQNQTVLGSSKTTRPRTELKFTDNLKARTLSFIWLQFHWRPYSYLSWHASHTTQSSEYITQTSLIPFLDSRLQNGYQI